MHKSRKHECVTYSKRTFEYFVAFIAFPFRWAYNLQPIDKFTAVLCVIGVFQVWSFVESERAVVVLTKTDFAKYLTPGLNPLPIHIQIRNGGKSTATIDVLKGIITHGPLPTNPTYLSGPQFAISPITPGEHIERILHFETGWNEAVTNEIKNGTRLFYFFGVIEYRDEFSRRLSWLLGPRSSGFCFIFKPTGGIIEPIFETCPDRAYTYTQ